MSSNYYEVRDSAEDEQFCNDNFEQIHGPIDSTTTHLNDEDINEDWYHIALDEILRSTNNIDRDNYSDTIDSNIPALFGDETLSLLEGELHFPNEMSFDHEDYSEDLTEESIDSAIFTEDKDPDLDNNVVTEMVACSKNTEIENNANIYSPGKVFCEINSSLEASPKQCETTTSETNLQPDEKILGENYVFELQCTHCAKTLLRSQWMNHTCEKQIEPRRKFSCKKCERTFYDIADLKKHDKTHFACSTCGENLAGKFSLKRHYRLKHGKTNVILI